MAASIGVLWRLQPLWSLDCLKNPCAKKCGSRLDLFTLILTQFNLLLDGRREWGDGLAGQIMLRAERFRDRRGLVASVDTYRADAVDGKLEEDARGLAAEPGYRGVRLGKQRHRRPRILLVAKCHPRKGQKKHEPVLVALISAAAVINTVVEEQRVARVAHPRKRRLVAFSSRRLAGGDCRA